MAPNWDAIDLTNRMARCGCGTERPSDPAALFGFEYRGPGSMESTMTCGECHYSIVAHTPEIMARPHMRHIAPHEFTPIGPAPVDRFYCGCRGWD